MLSLSLYISIATRNIVRQRRRSVIALGAVAFGIAALIVASGYVEWMLQTFREEAIRSQLGHIQIVRPGFHSAGKADPYAYMLPEHAPDLQTKDNAREFKAVAPRLSLSGLISRDDATISFIADGVDPVAEAAFGEGVQIVEGVNLASDQPRAIIVGTGLARNLGIKVGDRVVLLANTVSGGTNAIEVSVRGLFSTISKSYDDAALRLPLQSARELVRAQGSHVWVVLLKETSDTDSVVSSLRAKLPSAEFEVVPWYDLADMYKKTATLFRKQVEGVRVILAAIILLSILNTITISVMERTGEIGTSLALGMKRRSVLQLFILEGVLLGCFGGVLGVLLGVALAEIISAIGIPMPPPPGVSHGYMSSIIVNPRMIVEALVLAVLATLLASIYPAWKASRKVIVDALRQNR